jgi:DNA-directed RNA polymerase specialized sigma24 family protein
MEHLLYTFNRLPLAPVKVNGISPAAWQLAAVDPKPNPEELLLLKEREGFLRLSLEGVPVSFSDAFHMVHIEERSKRSVAEEFHISLYELNQRLSTVREKLKNALHTSS